MYGIVGQFIVDIKIGGKSYPVGEGRLQGLRLFQSVNTLGPTAVLAIEDRLNFLMELIPFTGMEEVEIGIGVDEDNIEYHTFVIFKGVPTSNPPDSHSISLPLISKDVMPLLTPTRYESYTSQKISQVVATIASDVGLAVGIQDETTLVKDWFCPGWTYAQFLRWLCEGAHSSRYDSSGYMWFVDLDDKLNFFSVGYAMEQDSTINLVMSLEEEFRTETRGEEQNEVRLVDYRLFFLPGLRLLSGGYGHTSFYYDFSTGVFSEVASTINSTTHKALSDWMAMPKVDESARFGVDAKSESSFQGVAVDSQDVSEIRNSVENRVVRAVDSLVKMEALIRGNLDVRPGQKVNLFIPSVYAENIVNQLISGSWLVERVVHQVVPEFITKLLLFRSGVNAADDSGLLSPPGGRV